MRGEKAVLRHLSSSVISGAMRWLAERLFAFMLRMQMFWAVADNALGSCNEHCHGFSLVCGKDPLTRILLVTIVSTSLWYILNRVEVVCFNL